MSFQLPKSVLIALTSLTEAGYEAFLVGGSVRDYLRGVPPHDFDITTSATPEETLSVFSSYRTVETGIKHGTVTVLIDDMPLEITTYRIDGDYLDRRRPESVSFTKNLFEDLSRRDFTVNAMAYHPTVGIVDPFSGEEDLKKACIRAVGDAEVRFEEDALRILRALRFSSVLGFSLEEKTEAAAIKKVKNLSAVSPERIREELCKLLLGFACDEVISKYASLLADILPIGKTPPSIAPLAPDLGVRLFALIRHNEKEAIEKTLTGLRFDKRTQKEVLALFDIEKRDLPCDKRSVKRLLLSFGENPVEKWLSYRAASGEAGASAALALYNEVIASRECYLLSHLQIGGGDLLPLCKGPSVGEALKACLMAVINGSIPNEKEALLRFSKEFIEENFRE